MTPGKRVFLALVVAALVLIALAAGMGHHESDATATSEVSAAAREASAAVSQAAAVRESAAAGSGAILAQAPLPERPPADGVITPECEECRKKECTNYQNSGVDLLSGCFKAVDPSQGADARDQRFVDDCAAVVRCAARTHCAEGAPGAAACYCGASISVDDCIDHGPAPDAPCADEFRRASRSRQHKDITERFSDLKYPSGWAAAMITCDQVECKSQCSG